MNRIRQSLDLILTTTGVTVLLTIVMVLFLLPIYEDYRRDHFTDAPDLRPESRSIGGRIPSDPHEYAIYVANKRIELINMVKGDNIQKAIRSARALGNMGQKAEPVLNDLLELKDHSDEDIRAAVREAIAKIEADLQKMEMESERHRQWSSGQ